MILKKKIKNILKKKRKKPITCLTAYSKPIAEILDRHCDMILVGDSVSMALYGMKTTREINLDTMILHGKAVKKSTKKSLVIFDMPYKTYLNKTDAYKNVKKVIRTTNCDAVKLEGGKKIKHIVEYLVKRGIPVMGHIGLLPQYAYNYKVKGKKLSEKKRILDDAIALAKSGAFAIVIECVAESLAKKITNTISIPTIGIGASKYCDGQVLVTDDMIGLSNFLPKFVKKYFNSKLFVESAVKSYCADVKSRRFPSYKNVYKL